MPTHAAPDDEYRAALERAALFDLSDHAIVELAGPDARPFLHNLCTNDVKNLPPGGGCESFLTTAKARAIAHAWVGAYDQPDGDVLWLDTVPGQADRVLGHLNHYLISEQVELTDRTAALALFRLCGPQSTALLQSLTNQSFADLPPLGNRRLDWPGVGPVHVRRHSLLGALGYDVFAPAEQAAALRQQLVQAGATPAGRQTYETLRIEAGLPAFGTDIDEDRFVVEVNRAAAAISYAKGCYLGQEPIVMARDRGQVNRLLLGVTSPGEEPLPLNAKLLSGETEVGLVKSSAWSPRRGEAIALAYLRRGNQEPGTALQTATGRVVRVAVLPFVETCSASPST